MADNSEFKRNLINRAFQFARNTIALADKFPNKRLRTNFAFFIVIFHFSLFIFNFAVPSAEAGTILQRPLYFGLTQGLVGFWSFDEQGTTAYDRSGQGNDGTLTNGPVRKIGKIGQALNFDGVNDFVDMDNVLNFERTQPFSVSAWVRMSLLGQPQSIIGKMNSSSFGWDVLVTGVDKLGLILWATNGTAIIKSSATSLSSNVWTHILVTYTGSSDAKGVFFFVNGVLTSDTTDFNNLSGSIITTVPLNIGSRNNGSVLFNGLIDEVRVYNRALSPDEIRRLYNMGATTKFNVSKKQDPSLNQGLVGLWTFDAPDMAGVTAYDRSGNSNNGTLTNSPTKTIGKIGQALNFDGVDDYTSLGNVGNVQSISYWIKPSVNGYSLSLSGAGSPKRYLLNNGLYNGTNTGTRYINGVIPTGESLGSEKLTNGTFETGSASPWDANVQGGAAGSVGITSSNPYAGTYALDFNITSGGTATYMAQARHNSNFSLTSGTLYKVQFAAKASSAKNGLNVTHQLSVSPWTGSGVTYTYDVTTSWVVHTYYFYSTQTASNIMTFFGAGNLGAFNLYLDNISIKPVTSIGDVTNGVWNFVSVNLDSAVSADDAYLATVSGLYLKGILDDVRVYNRALSPDEIKRLYNMGATTKFNAPQKNQLTNGLVGYWSFDGPDMAGVTAYDRSGQGNNGTLTNGPKKAIGKIGQALNFDGVNDYAQTSSGVSITSDFTYSVFIYPMQNSDGLLRGIISNLDYSPTPYGISLNQASQAISIYRSSGAALYSWSSKLANSNTWYHLTLTSASGVFNLYINGVLQSGTITQAIDQNNTKITIGRWDQDYNGYYFNGLIDDIRIYNRALSPDEIKRLYNMGR